MEMKQINCNQVQVSNKGRVCVFTRADNTLWAVCYGGEALGTMQSSSTRPFRIRHMYKVAAQYLGVGREDLLWSLREF
jgi:hypothetical protein